MSESLDPVERALQEIGYKTDETTVETEATTVETEATTIETEATTVETEATTVATEVTTIADFNFDSLTDEHKLDAFNKLPGMELKTLEDIQNLVKDFSGITDQKKNLDLFPKLVEQLKQSKNIVSHFPDETAYKVAQIVKSSEDYKGKESVINSVLREDVKDMSDMRAIELAARLNAPNGVRNPLRAKLNSLGISADEAISDYNSLEDDEKDLIAMAAGQAKKELAGLGKDIEIPSGESDVLAELEQATKAQRDDFDARKQKVAPIASSMIEDLKELTIDKDFNFKLDLSKEEKAEYSQFVIDSVMSGEYDLSTNKGKAQLWASVQDAVWLDKRDDIIRSLRNKDRESLESEFRAKYNNEKPLDKREPEPPRTVTNNPLVDLVEAMIAERK